MAKVKFINSMSKSVQHHYLPKHACLRFFVSPEKEGFMWMYQRGLEPMFVNIDKIAKERHLYSFTDKSGQRNTDLETALAEMEALASDVIEKLNGAQGPITITGEEKGNLALFVAMQAIRTPAFRNMLKLQAGEFAKLHMQSLASNKEVLAQALEEVKRERPDVPDIGVEEMQEFILDDSRYSMKMSGEDFFLKQAIELGDHLYPTVMMKDMYVLNTAPIAIVTSDYPVMLVANPSVPAFYGGGFLMSGILMPIGTHTALFCINPEKPKDLQQKDELVHVGYRFVPSKYAEWINNMTIHHAERFVFGASDDSEIKKAFDSTSKPKRFHISSPFSRTS